MNPSKYWGEFESQEKLPKTDTEISFLEEILITDEEKAKQSVPEEKILETFSIAEEISKSMKKSSLSSYPTEFDLTNEPTTQKITLGKSDPYILHAINLHKYSHTLSDNIRTAQLALQSNLTLPKDLPPPIPALPKLNRNNVPNKFHYLEKKFTPFTLGEHVDQIELTSSIAKAYLTKATAALLAQLGFKQSHRSVLDLLTDVLETFMQKICLKYKIFNDDEINEMSGSFPSVIERTLADCGFGGCRNLHDYYQNRVINYTEVLTRRCESLNEHYRKLLEPFSPTLSNFDLNGSFREGDCLNMVKIEGHEINLRTIENELSLSSLETGFQLLDSLENDESLRAVTENVETNGHST